MFEFRNRNITHLEVRDSLCIGKISQKIQKNVQKNDISSNFFYNEKQ